MLFFEIKCWIFASGSNMEIQNDARFLACVFKILNQAPKSPTQTFESPFVFLKSSIKSPRGTYLFPTHLGGKGGGLMVLYRDGGLIWEGCILNLAQTMVSFLHKELEYKMEKLKYKKLEVTQPRIKNKSTSSLWTNHPGSVHTNLNSRHWLIQSINY